MSTPTFTFKQTLKVKPCQSFRNIPITNLLNNKIEETLKAVSQLKETVVKLKQFERAALIREMEKQLEEMKAKVVRFKM